MYFHHYFRYGQDKQTHIYRLVTDNSLEKKIYDRQINKQGMSDRIVDELNPDAHLSSKDVHSLICDEEEDPEPVSMKDSITALTDPVMRSILDQFSGLLTKPPICHESQLVDRKDNKLSKAEKKLAERAYKLEKTSKITYSRPSYAAFYPKQGTFATNLHNPGSNGFTRNRYFENGKKLDNWMPASYSAGGSSATTTPGLTSNLVTGHLKQDKSFSSPLISNGKSGGGGESLGRGELPFPTPSFSNVLSMPPGSGGSGLGTTSSATSGINSASSKRTPDNMTTDKGKSSTTSQSSVGDWSKPSPSSSGAAAVRPRDNSVISRTSVVQAMTAPMASAAAAAAAAAGRMLPAGASGAALMASSTSSVGIQEVRVPRELVIPTNPGEPPIRLAAGQNVLVIRTAKGMYLRMDEKIIKIKQHSAVSGLFSGGNHGASSSSTGTASGSESSDSSSTSSQVSSKTSLKT